MSEKKRLFVDMDGTLAEFKVVDTLERLYEPHYFERLKPNMNVVEAVKDIVKNRPEIDVYILSAVLTDSKYALYEKKNWLKEYLPEIPEDRCIFPPCGSDKKDFIPNGIRSDDFLLDDYSLNLNSWEPPARGIKLLNGINGNNGTWDKVCVSYLNDGEMLSEKICAIINNDVRITEPRPQDLTDEEKFIARVNEIAEWSEEAQAKAAERLEKQERQDYNR
ncbi:MAG: hypothetical protein NC253_00730 [Ruminococcus sp.]|nr:hypothetical protein [Ruminococcus sp.]MCM1381064.1 hypothetical protein [Muribaculaceae bacterium]MCM1478575.1 hypothetical protein [Muribaculaceae bacterium]